MKTEEVLHPPGVVRQVVSPALLELAPVSVRLLDARKKPVPLSSAGYVLWPGRKYYLYAALPADPDLATVRLAAPPDFINAQEPTWRTNDKGNREYEIQFRVERGLRSFDIEADDLDLEFGYKAESGKPLLQLRLPVVIRPGLVFLLLSVLTALAVFFIPIWLSDSGVKVEDAANLAKYQSLMYSPLPWVLAGLVVTAVVLLYLYVFYQLRRRAGDLARDFQDYCSAGTPADPDDLQEQ